jgi:aromatic amino acid aminotransferase I
MVPPAAIEVQAVTDTQAITIPEPYLLPQKINEAYGRRDNLNKSQWGTAAHASSAQFKSLSACKGKPKAKRWDRK